jgi:FkbM family methyltransferase
MLRGILRVLRPLGDRLPWVAQAVRTVRDRWAVTGTPVMTPMGFCFFGIRSMMDGTFEAEETVTIRSLLQEIDLFVNVGANIGYYCCHACQLNVPVIAFEPIPLNRTALSRNLAANGWTERVDLRALAVSDRPGTATIYGSRLGASLIPGWAGSPEHYSTIVTLSTLDAEIAPQTAGRRVLIVVDIEGAEWRMLQGAAQVLSQSPKPIWIIEVAVAENQPAGTSINPHLMATFEMFWAQGYEARMADRSQRLITPDEVRAVVTTGRDTLGAHNFLFRDPAILRA